jgi:hypothetical protein
MEVMTNRDIADLMLRTPPNLVGFDLGFIDGANWPFLEERLGAG